MVAKSEPLGVTLYYRGFHIRKGGCFYSEVCIVFMCGAVCLFSGKRFLTRGGGGAKALFVWFLCVFLCFVFFDFILAKFVRAKFCVFCAFFCLFFAFFLCRVFKGPCCDSPRSHAKIHQSRKVAAAVTQARRDLHDPSPPSFSQSTPSAGGPCHSCCGPAATPPRGRRH